MNKTLTLPVYKGLLKVFDIEIELTTEEKGVSISVLNDIKGILGQYKEVDFFYALAELREDMSAKELMIGCKGALENVFPSGLSAEMSSGLVAYDCSSDEKIKDNAKVNIFDEVTPDEVSHLTTFVKQKKNRMTLIKSGKLGRR